jgi:hypothetical protein
MTDTPKNPPPDWALEMAKLDYNPMADIRAYAFATGGPAPLVPRNETSPPPPANTSGWQAERGLQPQPGIDLIDRMAAIGGRTARFACPPRTSLPGANERP